MVAGFEASGPSGGVTGATAGGVIGWMTGATGGAIEGDIGAPPGVVTGGVTEAGAVPEGGETGGIAGNTAGGLGFTGSLALAGCTPVELHGGTSTVGGSRAAPPFEVAGRAAASGMGGMTTA